MRSQVHAPVSTCAVHKCHDGACCRANLRLLALVALITALAAANSLVVPLALEGALARHVRTPALLAAAQTPQQGPPQPPSQWERLLRLNNTTGGGPGRGLSCPGARMAPWPALVVRPWHPACLLGWS